MPGYAVVIEGSGDSFSAYVPELPGCIATGESVEEVEPRIKEAIRVHVKSLRDHGEPVPAQTQPFASKSPAPTFETESREVRAARSGPGGTVFSSAFAVSPYRYDANTCSLLPHSLNRRISWRRGKS